MPWRVAIEKRVSPRATVYVAAAAGGVGLAAMDGVADGVGVAVDVGVDVGEETDADGGGEPSDGDGPTDAVVQPPSASAATMRAPASGER